MRTKNANNTILYLNIHFILSACPREHQAVVLHAISPISMKLCQFKGSTPKLKMAEWFLFWLFPGGDRPPPPVFSGFHRETASKQVKCMKLSLQLYLTHYPDSLQTYWYILKERMRHVSIYLIDGLSINSAEQITEFLIFSIHPNI